MLIFGPFSAAPIGDEKIRIFNLSSSTEKIPQLPGLAIIPPPWIIHGDGEMEKDFDRWYYNYVLEDIQACSSLMQILTSLYEGNNVYICISNYYDGLLNIINESFMKMIQTRYNIKYAIVNTKEDLEYIPKDGCDFGSVQGIKTFDDDRRRYLELMTEQQILGGHT